MDTHRVILALRTEQGFRYFVVSKGLEWPTAIELWETLDKARREGRLPFEGYLAVRSDADPDVRWSQATPLPKRLVSSLPGSYVKDEGAAGRKVAAMLGLEGRAGGWLYRDGKPVMQGYVTLARQQRTLSREWTSGKGFEVLRLPRQWTSLLPAAAPTVSSRRLAANYRALAQAV